MLGWARVDWNDFDFDLGVRLWKTPVPHSVTVDVRDGSDEYLAEGPVSDQRGAVVGQASAEIAPHGAVENAALVFHLQHRHLGFLAVDQCGHGRCRMDVVV